MAKVFHLAYHYVRNGTAPGPNCPPDRLQKQLAYLKDEKYEVLTCGEVAWRILSKKSLPERYATLSFDDGLRDQWVTAVPILQEFGFPATFFVIGCTLNGELPPVMGHQLLLDRFGAIRVIGAVREVYAGTPYLDLLDRELSPLVEDTRKLGEPWELRRIKWMLNHWASQEFRRDKLKELFEYFPSLGAGAEWALVREWFMDSDCLYSLQVIGMEIASHSMTHPPFDISGFAEIERECAESKRVLGEVLGGEPLVFAWPFGGKFSPKVQQTVMRHYQSAWNFLKLPRMPDGPYYLSDMPRLHEELVDLS